jgi:hypothetical protein
MPRWFLILELDPQIRVALPEALEGSAETVKKVLLYLPSVV